VNVHRFTSMGCDVVVGGATASEARVVELLFEKRDEMFSRFRDDSELSRVNRSASRTVSVTAPFAEMARVALRAAASTDGIVDPTLGDAIEAAGYDRDFADLDPSRASERSGGRGRWRDVRIASGFLFRPRGVRLDLNGVVKGRTVDDALELIRGDGFVCAGGDLAARGAVDVGLPGGGAVRLVDSGLATSGSAKRRWLQAGESRHHLIDARTGSPADSPWREVTVSAATCLQADIAAKAAFLRGREGLRFLERRGLAGRFLLLNGDKVFTAGRWPSIQRAA
jgi:thiamine biosynthesis lipoprotein